MDDLAMCSRLQQLLFLAEKSTPRAEIFKQWPSEKLPIKSIQQVEQKTEFPISQETRRTWV